MTPDLGKVRSTRTPLTVEQVVETEPDGTETHEVKISISTDEMISILWTICRTAYLLPGVSAHIATAGRPVAEGTALERLREMRDLADRLNLQPHAISLDPAAAEDLAIDLDLAVADPVRCPCGTLVQQPTQLTETCGECVTKLGGNR